MQDDKVRAALELLRQAGYGGDRVYVPSRPPMPEREIRAALSAGKTCRQVAREVGCSRSTVSAVGRRQRQA